MNSFINKLGQPYVFSELTWEHLKKYLNIEDSFTDDDDYLYVCIAAAKNYVMNYTSKTEEELDNIPSINIAVLMYAADFYSRRSVAYSYNDNKVNFVVNSILDQHRKYL